jgi:IS5 family transposase
VLEHQVMVGNPPDAPLLAPAVRRVIARTGNVPRAVTADRGYGEARFDRQRASAGWSVAHRLRGRISCLKHRFGWDRTRMDGIQGARICCGHGMFAHNFVKIGGLLEGTYQGET